MREEVRRTVLTHPSIRKNPAAPIWGCRTTAFAVGRLVALSLSATTRATPILAFLQGSWSLYSDD
jgi:hypothetical protein